MLEPPSTVSLSFPIMAWFPIEIEPAIAAPSKVFVEVMLAEFPITILLARDAFSKALSPLRFKPSPKVITPANLASANAVVPLIVAVFPTITLPLKVAYLKALVPLIVAFSFISSFFVSASIPKIADRKALSPVIFAPVPIVVLP